MEVLSPDDRRKLVRAKITEYLGFGVPLDWLVDPETKTVLVYSEHRHGIEYNVEDVLDGGTVLPPG